jgi:nitrate reductase gamma subunit
MPAKTLVEPDIGLIRSVMKEGGTDLKKCFQCATCASVCSLSQGNDGFPRRQVLLAQWGLKEELLQDPGPWLCFYCGDCSRMCPREANPGEAMMAIRRYLTTQYDWTGLSRRMYRSAFWEIGILAFVAAVVVMLFTLPHNFGFGLLSQYPAALSTVMLDKFAPKEVVHHSDQIMAAMLSFFLLTNAARMFFGLVRGEKIPARLYLTFLPYFVFQGVTQIKWRGCKDSQTIKNWLRHLFLVTGYVTIFTLVAIFLPWFQIENSSFHWTSLLGYYSTIVLLVTTAWILLDRARQQSEMHRFSHLSDWLFPILLFFTALTGILMHLLRMLNLAMPTYITYMVHLAIAVPMLMVEVPFGKWAHLMYRPLAIYVAEVRRKALEAPSPELAAAGQALARNS